jgi:hypothetical protein
MKSKTFIFAIMLIGLLSACGENSNPIIYENSEPLVEPYKIKLNEVKVVTQTDDSLTLDFIYTYNHPVPASEIQLFVLPDHGYWSTQHVKISSGTHAARVIMGLSKSNMHKDNVSESDTTTLRFRFDHYLPNKYMGNIWGEDVPFDKHWELH